MNKFQDLTQHGGWRRDSSLSPRTPQGPEREMSVYFLSSDKIKQKYTHNAPKDMYENVPSNTRVMINEQNLTGCP